jgi:hypothetical protein
MMVAAANLRIASRKDHDHMTLTVSFTPPSMTSQQYDTTIKRLEAAGAGVPAGRLYHVCFGSGNQLRVVDVWESQQAFDAFGKTLMPILQDIGLDPGQPEFAEAHHIIAGPV